MKKNKILNSKKGKIIIIFCAMSSFTLYGCNTIEGAGTDIKQGGRALERAAEHAKECPPRPCPCCKR